MSLNDQRKKNFVFTLGGNLSDHTIDTNFGKRSNMNVVPKHYAFVYKISIGGGTKGQT